MKIQEMLNKDQGLYVALKLNKNSAISLYNWAGEQGIEDIVPPDEMHCTIVYSVTTVPYYARHKIPPIVLDPETYKMTKLGSALVLEFDNEEVRTLWQYAMDLGASWDYDEYIPHITITYNGEETNEKDIEPPTFDIKFVYEHSEELEKEAHT